MNTLFYTNEILIEVRKNHFNKNYAIRIVSSADIHNVYVDWSMETSWKVIKDYLKCKNVKTPALKDIKFFSDGFEYSYGWFDCFGKGVGNYSETA